MSGFIGIGMRFVRNQDGATAIEYAFLAALIAVAIIASAILIGGEVSTSFANVAASFPQTGP